MAPLWMVRAAHGAEESGDEHHRQGATLGDATEFGVGATYSVGDGVVDSEVGDKSFVGTHDFLGHPRDTDELEEKLPVDLIEALDQVGGTTTELRAGEVPVFNLEGDTVPGILGSAGGGSGIDLGEVPGGNPWAEIAESDVSPPAVEAGEEGEEAVGERVVGLVWVLGKVG